jgi:BirA family biotin operon repressor/biotin-[acetyl-CoA-carboxylase] ligase
MKQENILSNLSAACPWKDTLRLYDTLESTNTLAKELAKSGAPQGTVVIADRQTGGRGRMGRQFHSPAGQGIYLSVILRPGCSPEKLMHLTCATAVAGCKAVEQACGVCPNIKWTNDLVYGKKKLGGILTELVLDGNGLVDCAIIGIGINCEKPIELPPELQNTVTSIQEISNTPCTPEKLTAKLIEALYKIDQILLTGKQEMMSYYRQQCITLGQEIKVVTGDSVEYGTALDLDEDGGLLVRFRDGSEKIVASGEVSVRGMYGYL